MSTKGVYRFDDFCLDPEERTLEKAGEPVRLTPKAIEVLLVLIENRGHIVGKDALMRRVWPGTFVEPGNLTFNISILRKTLSSDGSGGNYIETVPKRGYRFMAEVTCVVETSDVESAAPPPRVAVVRYGRLWAIAVLACLTLSILATWISTRGGHSQVMANPYRVVLAEFVNKTGDPQFDGALDQGLSIQLHQSPELILLSESEIRRTLRLMNQPPGVALTFALAQEVCERTGSSAAIDGAVSRLGTRYVIGLRAANCPGGDLLDDEQAQVGTKEEVLDALSRIITQLRARIGESSAALQKFNAPLAEVSTASLEALKAYSSGLRVHFTTGAKAALPFFQRAIEIDPEFAMAHSYVGRVYANLDETELAAQSIRRAWQLRNRTSDRERSRSPNVTKRSSPAM